MCKAGRTSQGLARLRDPPWTAWVFHGASDLSKWSPGNCVAPRRNALRLAINDAKPRGALAVHCNPIAHQMPTKVTKPPRSFFAVRFLSHHSYAFSLPWMAFAAYVDVTGVAAADRTGSADFTYPPSRARPRSFDKLWGLAAGTLRAHLSLPETDARLAGTSRLRNYLPPGSARQFCGRSTSSIQSRSEVTQRLCALVRARACKAVRAIGGNAVEERRRAARPGRQLRAAISGQAHLRPQQGRDGPIAQPVVLAVGKQDTGGKRRPPSASCGRVMAGAHPPTRRRAPRDTRRRRLHPSGIGQWDHELALRWPTAADILCRTCSYCKRSKNSNGAMP